MVSRFVEAETEWNWGKFLVMQWEAHEWNYVSPVSGQRLLPMRRVVEQSPIMTVFSGAIYARLPRLA